MSDPETKEKYLRFFAQNQQYTGYGFDTTAHAPCPFCAAPDWLVFKVIGTEEAMKQGAKCKHCGRAAKALFKRDASGIQFEFVQTEGPDPPSYLPPMKRAQRQ